MFFRSRDAVFDLVFVVDIVCFRTVLVIYFLSPQFAPVFTVSVFSVSSVDRWTKLSNLLFSLYIETLEVVVLIVAGSVSGKLFGFKAPDQYLTPWRSVGK